MATGFTLRAHRRVKTRCVLHYISPHVSGTGIVHDVSLAGGRVVGDQHVTQGDILSLRIFLPLTPDPIQIEFATVQWVKGREFGLNIVDLNPLAATAITAFIQTAVEPIHTNEHTGSPHNG